MNPLFCMISIGHPEQLHIVKVPVLQFPNENKQLTITTKESVAFSMYENRDLWMISSCNPSYMCSMRRAISDNAQNIPIFINIRHK